MAPQILRLVKFLHGQGSGSVGNFREACVAMEWRTWDNGRKTRFWRGWVAADPTGFAIMVSMSKLECG